MKLVMRIISLQFSILMFLMTVWLVASGIFNFYNLTTMHIQYSKSMYEQVVGYLIVVGFIVAITSSAGYISLKAGTKGANNQELILNGILSFCIYGFCYQLFFMS